MTRSPNPPSTRDTRLIAAAPPDDNRPYLLGVVGGALAGLFSAYIFKRASAESPAGRKPVSTGQIFTVIMSVLTLVRQIAEMGKQPEKKK